MEIWPRMTEKLSVRGEVGCHHAEDDDQQDQRHADARLAEPEDDGAAAEGHLADARWLLAGGLCWCTHDGIPVVSMGAGAAGAAVAR